jgi:hypothetical protein
MEDVNMESFPEYLFEYRKQLEKGDIKKAYKGLMEYITGLRLHLKNKFPGYFVSGSVQYGYMDYTYFYFFPESIKQRNLKIVIIFIHDTFTFEAWLSGYNRTVQAKYLELVKKTGWVKYNIAPASKGVDYIIKSTLADNPDFSDLKALTKQIVTGTLEFINDIQDFLSKH